MAATAMDLKELGNKAFSEERFEEANILYTRAIQRDPTNAAFFTNRAFTRLKLSQWHGCLDDSLKAIDLFPPDDKATPVKMKAYYYLAQAQLSLRRPGEALASATRAYEMARALQSPSMEQLSTLVLRAKRDRWDVQEKERLRRKNTLLQEVEQALWKLREAEEAEAQQSNGTGQEQKQEQEDGAMDADAEDENASEPSPVREAYERRLREVREVFARADPDGIGNREVPDYLVDNITFAVMQDPVITKRGHSYERATLIAHLRNSETDPLTREPLTIKDLRPNLALKEASARFLETNGWAVDW